MSLKSVVNGILGAPGYVVGATLGGVRRGYYALGYDAAMSTRHRNSLSGGRSTPRQEDSMLGTSDRINQRQKCLDLVRNSATARGIITRISDHVVGNGIWPQAQTDDLDWNAAAEDYWRQWTKVCDYRQRIDIVGFQRLAVQQRIWAGDLLFNLLKNGQIEPIEGELIGTPAKLKASNPNIHDGVKVDAKTGIILGWYILPRDRNGSVDFNAKDAPFVPRENGEYMSNPFRFSQVRGIPDMVAVYNLMNDVRDMENATLERARLEAKNAYAIYSDSIGGPGGLGPRVGSSSDSGAQQYEKIENGQTYYLRPGEKAGPLALETPHSQYDTYSKSLLRQICQTFGFPYEFIFLDFSQSNYSNTRAGLMLTHRSVETWQAWLIKSMQRFWNWRIAKAVKAGELKQAPVVNGVSQWWRVDWQVPNYEWVDPQNKAQIDLLEYQMAETSLRRLNAKRGQDWETVAREKAEELARITEIAQEVSARTGVEITPDQIVKASIPGQQQGATQ